MAELGDSDQTAPCLALRAAFSSLASSRMPTAFGPTLAKQIPLLCAVHLAACDLAKNALNWSLGAVLTREHASPLFLRLCVEVVLFGWNRVWKRLP
ncbi:MAG: hypothetical protein DMG96_37225 [Acidobacteria bacterium]|nr:MAG: hypothetical protein DMG96_37225 [Acidobacteriota bacterium]